MRTATIILEGSCSGDRELNLGQPFYRKAEMVKKVEILPGLNHDGVHVMILNESF